MLNALYTSTITFKAGYGHNYYRGRKALSDQLPTTVIHNFKK